MSAVKTGKHDPEKMGQYVDFTFTSWAAALWQLNQEWFTKTEIKGIETCFIRWQFRVPN